MLKQIKTVALIALVSTAFFNASAQNNETVQLTSQLDSFSYSIGVQIGSQLKSQGMDTINYEALIAAMKDVLNSGEVKMDKATSQRIVDQYFRELQTKVAKENLHEGELYLATNSKRPEVTTLASGLQYEVVEQGTGPKPTSADRVKVHYTGKLINGEVFDSSVERGQPAVFGVTQVIAGWTEALQLMNTGSKWILYIPADLAYGSRGRPGIPANSVLVFEVELIKIVE